MPDGWTPLNPGEIVIAHLSDLHLGSPNAELVRGLVAGFLTGNVNPKLTLVRAELVHSPEQILYERAHEKLASLRVPFYVCSGNHDRHIKGNRITPEDIRSILGHRWVAKGVRIVQIAFLVLLIVIAVSLGGL